MPLATRNSTETTFERDLRMAAPPDPSHVQFSKRSVALIFVIAFIAALVGALEIIVVGQRGG